MTRVSLSPVSGAFAVSGELFGEPVTSGMGATWAEQSRPLRDPLLALEGRELIGGAFSVVLSGGVANQVRWLRRFMRGAEGDDRSTPSPVRVDAQGAWDLDVVRHPGWLWVIRDVVEREDDLLSYGARGVTRQRVDVSVSRWVEADLTFRRGGRPLTDAANIKGYTIATERDAKYGWYFLTTRIYGTGSRVGDVMRLNKATARTRIRKGQRVKLP